MGIAQNNALGGMHHLGRKQARSRDDLITDYIRSVLRPGDRSLQLGRSPQGLSCLQRGAFHEVQASPSARESFQRQCAERETSLERLQPVGQSEGELDLAIIGQTAGFADLASHWPAMARRLKRGGVLILCTIERGAVSRLSEALFADGDWALEEIIAGEAAVYRKIRLSSAASEMPRLQEDARSEHRPSIGKGLMSGVVRTLFGRGEGPRSA